MRKFIIQEINLETLDTDSINNNNLPKDKDDVEAQEQDYRIEMKKTWLCEYHVLLNYEVKFTYQFNNRELEILKTASSICSMRKKISGLYEDDLQIVIQRLSDNWIPGKYFIRLDACSAKDGMVKGPIMSAKDTIYALVTSSRIHTSLKIDNTNILYFVTFDESWDQERELRVFVRHNKITCISQYDCYKRGYFSTISEDHLLVIGQNVERYVNEVIKIIAPKINTSDFVVDVYVNKDFTIKLVELNCFGYWLAAGSALFNWSTDRDILYDTNNDIHFRILK